MHWGPAWIASLLGTMVFGMMMQMMGMMGMVGMLVRSHSLAVAWGLHLAIGSSLGLGFAVWSAAVPLRSWLSGLLYGMVVWMMGPLVLMPLALGSPGMVLNVGTSTVWLSLMGHMVWGLVMGLLLARIAFGAFGAGPARADRVVRVLQADRRAARPGEKA